MVKFGCWTWFSQLHSNGCQHFVVGDNHIQPSRSGLKVFGVCHVRLILPIVLVEKLRDKDLGLYFQEKIMKDILVVGMLKEGQFVHGSGGSEENCGFDPNHPIGSQGHVQKMSFLQRSLQTYVFDEVMDGYEIYELNRVSFVTKTPMTQPAFTSKASFGKRALASILDALAVHHCVACVAHLRHSIGTPELASSVVSGLP